MSPWPGLRPRRRPAAFTLVELLVVVLIIGILAAIALPRFLGQRTRSKNAAAQSAVRHALLAARSYYTQNSESYAGLGPAELKGYESSLSGTEPADGQAPGSSANPQDIWIGNGTTSSNPLSNDSASGRAVVLCSVSRGDSTYCVRDVDGAASSIASYAGSPVQTAATIGPSEAGGKLWDAGSESRTGGANLAVNGDITYVDSTGGSLTFDNAHPGYNQSGRPSSMGIKAVGSAGTPTFRTNAGILSNDGSELRFWIYVPSGNAGGVHIFDNSNVAWNLFWRNTGTVEMYMYRAASPYNIGWDVLGNFALDTLYQFRVVLNFTAGTWTLSSRTSPSGSWTQYKKSDATSYNLPMPYTAGTTPTASSYVRLYPDAGTTFWLDELQYSNTGILDLP